jgi:hypothetical protein
MQALTPAFLSWSDELRQPAKASRVFAAQPDDAEQLHDEALIPELNSKRRNRACNTLISLFWSLDFSKTWCHVCLFIGLECGL